MRRIVAGTLLAALGMLALLDCAAPRLAPIDAGDTATGADGGESAAPTQPSTATLLLSAPGLGLWGVTSDGWVVYRVDQVVYAVPIDGGPAVTVGDFFRGTTTPPIPPPSGFVSERVVVIHVLYYVLDLEVWTAAAGLQFIASADTSTDAVVSGDSSYVTAIDNLIAGGGDLNVARTDGTGSTLVASGLFLGSTTCPTFQRFVGSFLVVFPCSEYGWGYSAFDFLAPGWTAQSSLESGSPPMDLDDTRLLFADSSGLEIVPLATGLELLLDPEVAPGSGATGALTPEGSSAVYVAPGGAFKRVAVDATSPPTVLVDAGVSQVVHLSPDGQNALVQQTYDPQSGEGDLYVASAVLPGPLLPLVMTPTISSSGFVGDGSQVFYTSGVSPTTQVGALYRQPISPPGAAALLAQAIYGQPQLVGATGLVYLDNATGADSSSTPAAANIEWVDVAQAAPPAQLAVQALPSDSDPSQFFFLTAQGDRVVFAAPTASGQVAVYVVPIP
jgi:hypothetical protein